MLATLGCCFFARTRTRGVGVFRRKSKISRAVENRRNFRGSSRALENQSILEGASVLDADAGPGPPDLGPLAE